MEFWIEKSRLKSTFASWRLCVGPFPPQRGFGLRRGWVRIQERLGGWRPVLRKGSNADHHWQPCVLVFCKRSADDLVRSGLGSVGSAGKPRALGLGRRATGGVARAPLLAALVGSQETGMRPWQQDAHFRVCSEA